MSKFYFVVRDTNHPAEDLERNWSSFLGGSCEGEKGGDTEEEAIDDYARFKGINISEVDLTFRYHPAFECFVAVDYEGLGAFALESKNMEEALKEAENYSDHHLGLCHGSGDGHFYAEDCISYHKVREGRYVFKIKGL